MPLRDGRHPRALGIALALAVLAIAGVVVGVAVAASQIWTAPTELALPTLADPSPGAVANAISCAGPGNCVAGGTYTQGSHAAAFVASLTNGVWAQATKLTMPTGVFNSAGPGLISVAGVNCVGAGDCVATGFYADTSGDSEAFVAGEAGEVWSPAQMLVEPGGAASVGSRTTEGVALSCPSAGNCTAGGYYTHNGGEEQPFIATEANGTWGADVAEPALPSPNSTGTAAITGLSCPGVGSCSAAGYYQTSGGREPMVASEAAATWSQATELAPPSGHSAQADAVACTSPGKCAAGGQYTDASSQTQAFVADELGGVWGSASELALPGNAAISGQSAAVTGISCPSAGVCVAVGSYTDTSAQQQAFAAQETNGSWGQASELADPSGSQTASATSVWCTGVGVCVAAGSFRDSGGASQAMVANEAPTLSLSTASLPGATIGTAYSTQLAASGGLGSYHWTVRAGVLPTGLSLNSATGVISGTPTAVGSATFGVSVSDPGPPSQQAGAMLTIGVAPLPATATTIGTKTIKPRNHKHSASFSFSANGGTAGFQCALVRQRPARRHGKHKRRASWPAPSYAACTSPKAYRNLAKGSYRFYVRAVLPDGTFAPAATDGFRIP